MTVKLHQFPIYAIVLQQDGEEHRMHYNVTAPTTESAFSHIRAHIQDQGHKLIRFCEPPQNNGRRVTG